MEGSIPKESNSEGYGELGLRGNPSVGDEVLWGQRLEHGDKQIDGVFILAELLLEEDELVVEDHLAVHVL